MKTPYHQAAYSNVLVAQGQGNPLIEALGPPLSDLAITETLLNLPPFSPPNPKLSAEHRRQALSVIEEVFSPFPRTVRFARSIDDATRCGYICRNPMKVGYWNHEDDSWVSASHRMGHQTITGISLAGESGLGKSHTLRTISNTTPQVIQHSNYRPPDLKQARKVPGLESLQAEQKFSHIQITHLFVECPAYSQSPKNMAKAIFAAADEALQDTDYYNRYGRGSVTDLENNAHRLAKNHSLGTLWIDEVQRLMDSKPTINFLVSLNNIIRIPIVMVGTEESVAMFKKDRSIARRGNKFGDHYWKRINWHDPKGRRDWCNFIKAIEPYQVLKKYVKLNDDLCELIWKGSAGIPDYAIKIFRQAQCRALDCGMEELSPNLITSVSDTLSYSNDFLINPDEH